MAAIPFFVTNAEQLAAQIGKKPGTPTVGMG
jgi:hypothetical protein